MKGKGKKEKEIKPSLQPRVSSARCIYRSVATEVESWADPTHSSQEAAGTPFPACAPEFQVLAADLQLLSSETLRSGATGRTRHVNYRKPQAGSRTRLLGHNKFPVPHSKVMRPDFFCIRKRIKVGFL